LPKGSSEVPGTFLLWLEDREFSYGSSEIHSIAGWLFINTEVISEHHTVNTGIEFNVFVAYPKD